MKLLLISLLLFNQGCKNLVTEVKDDASHHYFLNLSADGFGYIAIVADNKGGGTVALCATTSTREKTSRCNSSYDVIFPIKIKKISFPDQELTIDTDNQDLLALDDMKNYGISSPYLVTVEFDFYQSGKEVYNCTLEKAPLGRVHKFTVAKNCTNTRTDENTQEVAVTYTYNTERPAENILLVECSINIPDYDDPGKLFSINTAAEIKTGSFSFSAPTESTLALGCRAVERSGGGYRGYQNIGKTTEVLGKNYFIKTGFRRKLSFAEISPDNNDYLVKISFSQPEDTDDE